MIKLLQNFSLTNSYNVIHLLQKISRPMVYSIKSFENRMAIKKLSGPVTLLLITIVRYDLLHLFSESNFGFQERDCKE